MDPTRCVGATVHVEGNRSSCRTGFLPARLPTEAWLRVQMPSLSTHNMQSSWGATHRGCRLSFFNSGTVTHPKKQPAKCKRTPAECTAAAAHAARAGGAPREALPQPGCRARIRGAARAARPGAMAPRAHSAAVTRAAQAGPPQSSRTGHETTKERRGDEHETRPLQQVG
jgi:hypothetical protein